MATISIRYAKALLDISDKYKENLISLSNIYKNNNEFKLAFDNPEITIEEKIKIIKTMFNEKEFVNFVNLLLNANRFKYINDIANKYSQMLDEKNKKLNLEIISATELTDNQITKITNKFKKITKAKEISYIITIDKRIIGGIKVKTNNKIYDDTISTKLKEML